jgi:hypothetical protein
VLAPTRQTDLSDCQFEQAHAIYQSPLVYAYRRVLPQHSPSVLYELSQYKCGHLVELLTLGKAQHCGYPSLFQIIDQGNNGSRFWE